MVERDGGSFYDEQDVHARYTAHRDDERRPSPNHVMEEPAVLAEVGDPTGLRVLDLGCGDGEFGRRLLAAGARAYLGIDSSHRMVESAERNLIGTPGVVRTARIEDVSPRPESFDLITARLSLHYVADVDSVVKTAAQGLDVGGRLIFTVVHPVITSYDNQPAGPRTSWTVDEYFATGPRQWRWMGSEVTWHHRTIEDYVRSVTNAGLTLTALRECEPDPARFGDDLTELGRRRRVPLFLLINARV